MTTQQKGNTMPDLTAIQDLAETINANLTEVMRNEGVEDNFENRARLLQEFLDDMKKELPDTFTNRTMTAMFAFFIENLNREAEGLEPIPFL